MRKKKYVHTLYAVYAYTASGQIYNKLILMVASGEGALKTRDRDGNKTYTVQLFVAFKKLFFHYVQPSQSIKYLKIYQNIRE